MNKQKIKNKVQLKNQNLMVALVTGIAHWHVADKQKDVSTSLYNCRMNAIEGLINQAYIRGYTYEGTYYVAGPFRLMPERAQIFA